MFHPGVMTFVDQTQVLFRTFNKSTSSKTYSVHVHEQNAAKNFTVHANKEMQSYIKLQYFSNCQAPNSNNTEWKYSTYTRMLSSA